MIKIAAFIIPKKKMRLKILNLKKKVKINFGNQPYLSHPPHCTLFTMNVPANIIRKSLNWNKQWYFLGVNNPSNLIIVHT